MQVADQASHITHVVLGGAESISFGISDDPAFFQILSSALYKDPLRAMIRETICNAWDAHIDAGREAQPISITLSDDKLIIRDYGKGIPDALIGPIYAVYGASTKKKDGRQTGGFGLGCKSPFAYTDHFQVVSHHAGVKTIYNVSKSSAEKMGKPGINKIASFPTEESGIEVSINLKGDDSDDRIEGLIYEVVYGGDISALLNGKMLPNMGLSKTENGFILLATCTETEIPNEINHGYLSHHKIYVRYGNVIYPVEQSEAIAEHYNRAVAISYKRYGSSLLMMAPPDSISVTPSRESLTMSDLTIETLKTLLNNFVSSVLKNFKIAARSKEIVAEFVVSAAESTVKPIADKLHLDNWNVPGVPSNNTKQLISSNEDISMLETLLRYSKRGSSLGASNWLNSMNLYLNTLVKNGEVDRGRVQTWQNTARKAKKYLNVPGNGMYEYFNIRGGYRLRKKCEVSFATQWWQLNVLKPLMKSIKKVAPSITENDVHYFSDNCTTLGNYRNRIGNHEPVNKVAISSHTGNILHLLKPAVVISYSNTTVNGRHNWVDKSNFNSTFRLGTFFSIEIPKEKGDVNTIKEALLKMDGIDVIDLTGRTPYEQMMYEKRKASAKKSVETRKANVSKVPAGKKVKPGLICMSNLIDPAMGIIDTLRFTTLVDPERIVEPEFIELISTSVDKRTWTKNTGSNLALLISKVYGSKGAITNNSTVYERYIEKGVPSLNKYILGKLLTDIAVDPEVIRYQQFDFDKTEIYCAAKDYSFHRKIRSFMQLLEAVPNLNSEIPGYTPFSDETLIKVALWKECVNTYWHDEELRKIQRAAQEVELTDQVKEFIDKLAVNPFLKIVSEDEMKSLYFKCKGDPVVVQKLADIIKLIIN